MKKCKKLGALLLALTMVVTSGIMSFADGDGAAEPVAETTATTESGDEVTTDSVTGGEQDVEQTESQDTGEHPHNPIACGTCKGEGKIAQAADMTPYEEAYKDYEQLVVSDTISNVKQNAITCLGKHGVDTEDDFAAKYAKYMADAAYIAWAFNQIYTDGPDCWYVLMMETPDNKKETAIASLERNRDKLVEPKKTADYTNCPDCDGGKVPCTGKFDDGKLISVNDNDGTGVVEYTCDACDKTYTDSIDAAEVSAALARNVIITGPTASVSGERIGKKVKFTVSVENNGLFSAPGAKLTLTLADGWELAGDNPVSTNHNGDTFQIDGSKITVTLKELKTDSSYEITVYAKLTKQDAVIGTTYDALTLESATMNDSANTLIPLPEDHVAKVRANKYKGRIVAVAGTMLARNYGNDAVAEGSLEDSKNLGMLDDIIGKVFQFENFHASYTAPERGETVFNSTTQKPWKCVGFIPANFNNSQPEVPDLLQRVFSSTKYTLADVKKYVTEENNGVLYREAVTEEQLGEWQNMDGGYSTIFLLPVWYVMENPIKLATYEDLSVPPVSAPVEAVTSNGITVKCTAANKWRVNDKYHYEADLAVTIGEDAPLKAHVNLNDAIAAAVDKFNEEENIQPGDTLNWTLTIKNESGREYSYVNKSGIIATKNSYVGGEIAGVGFDGFKLSMYTKSAFSSYARRIPNAPLKALGLSNMEEISDASLGAALLEKGYGKGIENPEDVTKQCLGNYYLDWINSVREAQGKEPAKNFGDLTGGELAVLTGGATGGQVPETCQPVVEGLYYFYYGQEVTFNGKSIYEQMKNRLSDDFELEKAIPEAINGTPYQFDIKVGGNEGNNGYQNTKFIFRVEFDLKTPDPTPISTPDPTPEPEPTPDPQPLPPDDPLEEPDPTPDPQPLPPDDPLEEPEKEVPAVEPEDPDQPKTGDQSDLALWLGVMVLAGGAVVAMRVRRKKED